MKKIALTTMLMAITIGTAAAQRPAQPRPQPAQTPQPPATQPQEREQEQITTPQAQRPQFPGARRQEQPREQEPELTAPGPGQPAQQRVPEERTVVTHHSARIGGQTINYTATAGTYVVRGEDGTPKASMFFVAYTKDAVDSAKRPVTFVYNGGPGSASLFTHMGMGPRRVVLKSDGSGMPAPYTYTDNNESYLDATDLVFIDAIGTGFSRPAPGQNRSQFYGVIEDANWFSDFIYNYITRNDRWSSPKFLIGESYGTTRSAELAGVLEERHNMYLNGIVLVSSMAFANWGGDDRTIFFLPTYVTSAWYHKLLPQDLQSLSIDQVAQRAREFAHGEYAQALEKGDQLSPQDYDKVVQDLAHYTGLKPEYIKESNLRISPFRWFKELMRDKRRTVGRLDSRFLGMDVDAAGERAEYDPSEASYLGAFVGAFHDYVRRELGWKDDDIYFHVSGNVRPWDQTGYPQVAEVLRSAMTQESNLKLLVVCGYYDLATPFNGIEETISHANFEPEIRKNVSFTYYQSGHMVYIDDAQRAKLHDDIDKFINSSYPH